MNGRNLIALFLIISGFLLSGITTAENDIEQLIHIESDRAELDEKLGTTTYSGDVAMSQGSMKIMADEITIHSSNNKVTQIIATGEPATYSQIDNQGKSVSASANVIEYTIIDEQLILESDAVIQQQDGTTMSGQRIQYDIANTIVRADSDTNSNERIQMIIPPRQTESAEQ